MIWVILEKKNHHSIYNLKIIEWIRNNLQKNNLDYKLLFVNDYMFDNEFSQITNKDYVFWNPNIASKYISNVINFARSIVILEHQTLLNEKTSNLNPINENQAVAYGFYLMYLNEKEQVSREWKLAIQSDNYLMSQETVLNNLMKDENNFKKIKVERKDIFDDLTDFVHEQFDFN